MRCWDAHASCEGRFTFFVKRTLSKKKFWENLVATLTSEACAAFDGQGFDRHGCERPDAAMNRQAWRRSDWRRSDWRKCERSRLQQRPGGIAQKAIASD